jgi:DNA-binding NarL/FixJ family response regulator
MRSWTRHDDGVDQVGCLRLLVVDDHEVVRAGLASTLSQDPGLRVVGSAGSGAEAVELAGRERPDVAIVDMRLPDMPGPLLCRRLRERLPSVSVVVLSSYLSEDAVREAIAAGASAYVTKAAGLSELRRVLAETVRDGGPPGGVSQIVRRQRDLDEARARDDAPTPRQARVLELVAQGLTYAEVAERLVISESTVRFHVQRLKLKLGTNSRTELVLRAVRSGFIAGPEDEGGR